ncbi:MAG TPA: alpha/beta hydrolase [Solirubrobacteraceae bacterium]
MPTIDLPQGTINYRVTGPDDAKRPVVFVHGFLVNGELWHGVQDALARQGVRSYAPDWPLGSHTTPMNPDADQTPRGLARTIIAFLEALDLDDVTLVGNDSGGALSQFTVDTDHRRIGRLVLTNCDAFDQFPPSPFDKLMATGQTPAGLLALLTPTRVTAVRHSPAGFGLLVAGKLDAEQTRRWVDPCLDSAEIRRDTAKFLKGIEPDELLDVATRLPSFDKPVLLVWGDADRFFKVDFARRLANVFPNATLVEVAGGKTFLPLDEPGRVADEIAKAFYSDSAPAGIDPAMANSSSAS